MALCKIKEITEEHILFEDGSEITYYHGQDCCEWNYADFEQLDDIARNTVFDTENLKFYYVNKAGFSFGNDRMFFVPCYSEQNGYYSDDIDILFNGVQVFNFNCKFVEC